MIIYFRISKLNLHKQKTHKIVYQIYNTKVGAFVWLFKLRELIDHSYEVIQNDN